jgi:hypothetical protein
MILTWFELQFPRDLTSDAVLNFTRSLAVRPRHGLLQQSEPVVFEVCRGDGQLRWFLGLRERETRAVLAQLRTHHPGVRVFEVEHPASDVLDAGELRLNTVYRELRSDVVETASASLLTAMQQVGHDETLIVQWIVGPWLPRPLIKKDGVQRSGLGWERLHLSQPLDNDEVRALIQKYGEPLFGVVGRIGVRAASRSRRRQLMQTATGALHLTRQPGVALVMRLMSSRRVVRRMHNFTKPLIAWPCPLNARELVTVFGWPIGNPIISGISYRGGRQLPPPAGSVVSEASSESAPAGRYRVLGRASYPGQEGLAHLPAERATYHTWLLGPTGAGKSTVATNLIAADMAAGRSVCVIEPKSDLINAVLERVPPDRLDDVVLIDPTDTGYPVGLDVLACRPDEAELVVDQLLHVFRELYRASWGQRTEDVISAGLLTIARAGDQSFCELPVLLTNPTYRHRLLPRVNDPIALQPFWSWFESLSDNEQLAVIGPSLNKLRAFTYRKSIRRILGQTNPSFSMRSLFTDRRIVLVNLSKGVIGPEAARLLGALILSHVWQTALGRVTVDPALRHPVMLYVDEVQDYVRGIATDFGEVLAQARGLGVAMTLAHQNLSQLDPLTQAAVIANARSRLIFQASGRDANTLAGVLGGGLTADDLQSLGPYEAYAMLAQQGGASTPPFSVATLPAVAPTDMAEKARERSREQFGRPGDEVDAAILERRIEEPNSSELGGRRRRSP